MNWKQKILDDSGNLLLLTTHFAKEGEAFYYMLLSASNRRALRAAIEQRIALDLHQFGQIIRSGWGSPTNADKQFLREHYNAAV